MALLSPARSGVRALQAVSAIVAMIFTSLGYIEFSSGQLSSGAAILSTIANYSAMICGIWYVVALGSPLQSTLSPRAPKVWYQRVIDVALIAVLVLAGALHATSSAVKECASYNLMFETYHGSSLFRCSNMTVGIIFTFVTAALLLVSLVWSFARDSAVSTTLNKDLATEEEPSASREYAGISTPTVVARSAIDQVEARRPALRAARRGGRALQFVCSVVALVATVLGYKHYFTGQYLSPKATFVILMAYTCMVYSLWHLVAVETLKLSRRPALSAERVVDGVLALLLLIAGVVFMTSPAVTDCSDTNESFEKYHAATLFRCGSMGLGAVFSFIAVVMYVATFALSFFYGGVVASENGPAINGSADAANRV